YIDFDDLAVRMGAAIDAARQHSGLQNVGGIFGAAGYFFRPVDHRHIAADIVRRNHFVHGDTPCALRVAAYCTASMIFTYPVQRQILLPSASRISASLGLGFFRSRPAEAMMKPGVQ